MQSSDWPVPQASKVFSVTRGSMAHRTMPFERLPHNAMKRQELVEKSIKNLYNALLHRLICYSHKNLRGRFFRSVWTVLS
jgi:hypothetical protein